MRPLISKENATLVAAIIAAVAAIVAGGISALGTRYTQQLEEQFTRTRESTHFLREKITKLYLPVSMHLSVTKQLFDRYFEETTTPTEKIEIEHALREHNKSIHDMLISGTIYLEPEASKCVSTDLLEHLVQWETVYQLKYKYKVYKGPVFAGIERFGFRGFPRCKPLRVDEYYANRTEALRRELHERLVPK